MSRKSETPKRSVTISILAVIGGVSAIVALGVWGKSQWHNRMMAQAPWSVPYRDCIAPGDTPLSDADLIVKAAAQREEGLRMYSEAYKHQYVDGPVLPEKSKVYRWVTPRDRTEAKRIKPNIVASGYYAAENAAGLGLNRYATVQLVMRTVSQDGMTQEYANFDICGYGF